MVEYCDYPDSRNSLCIFSRKNWIPRQYLPLHLSATQSCGAPDLEDSDHRGADHDHCG